MTARRACSTGARHHADILELASELAPLHLRDTPLPGEVFPRVTAHAQTDAGPAGPTRGPWRGLRQRTLPEPAFRSHRNASSSTQCRPQRLSTGNQTGPA